MSFFFSQFYQLFNNLFFGEIEDFFFSSINPSASYSSPVLMISETTLNKVEKSSLMFAYEVNAVGPTLVIKVFFSNSFSVRLCCVGLLLLANGEIFFSRSTLFHHIQSFNFSKRLTFSPESSTAHVAAIKAGRADWL